MLRNPFDPEDKINIFRQRKKYLQALYDLHFQLFPTDEACLSELARHRGEDKSWICPHCKRHDLSVRFTERSTCCRSCGKRSWHTAGTLFSHIKRPRAWLFAIWLMERGEVISSNCLHEIAAVAQSTALNIHRKLRMVMERNMEDDAPGESSASFTSVVCKRSRETPARCHPTLEESVSHRDSADAGDALDDGNAHGRAADSRSCHAAGEPAGDANSHADDMDDSTSEQMARLTDEQKCVYRAFGADPISLEELIDKTQLAVNEIVMAITALQLEQLVTTIGAKFVRCCPRAERTAGHASPRDVHNLFSRLRQGVGKNFNSNANSSSASESIIPGSDGRSEIQITLAQFMEFVRHYYHGISRKYLQHYVMAFWCHLSRDRWGPDSLRVACLRSDWITDEEVLAYVTAPIVKMFHYFSDQPNMSNQNEAPLPG